MADEAVLLGPPPAAESYLVIDRIVEACRATGAEAVHPGYGFLSERAAFAQALEEAGIAFIGPPVGGDRGDGRQDRERSSSRAAAGVSTVPGTVDAGRATPARALEIAREIGYPVMIKASAGGGGKGMRIARDDGELLEGFERAAVRGALVASATTGCSSRSTSSEPRHIEIQVLGDRHGNLVYLGERECSIQRRHQKVIEEAPSPFLDEATRRAMGEQAVALARAVGYHSAGTVEFIVDRDRNFYFLEMNTRLQVEHPVTELVTGLDLVELMIRVAAGEQLAVRAGGRALDGWAIEARVYAEDPRRGFLPSIGRLRAATEEPAGEGVRVDSGVCRGRRGLDVLRPDDRQALRLRAGPGGGDAAAARALDALRGPRRRPQHSVPRRRSGQSALRRRAPDRPISSPRSIGERFQGVTLPRATAARARGGGGGDAGAGEAPGRADQRPDARPGATGRRATGSVELGGELLPGRRRRRRRR